MIRIALFLLLPIFSYSQVSVSTGMLSTGRTSLKTGLAFNITAGLENERMAAGLRYTTSEIKDVRFNQYQFYIGPRWGSLQLGLTFDQTFSSFQDLRNESQGLGIRAAYNLHIREGFEVIGQVNSGIDGNRGKYIQLLFGISYHIKKP